MWYFAWILGVGLASAFSILNAMWYELRVAERALEAEDRVEQAFHGKE